ncbi:Dam family site-specific DNA-(adenine-N6)-methyltransferase [Clavibacter michiganensis]|nr:Dam family site-specific DNA-(adenine-N6)-methyltransferase [Clavibacter michiganensis]
MKCGHKLRKLVTRSPLRWAGSKRSLLPLISGLTPDFNGQYVEPFMGSACVFFNMKPKKATLSDFNGDLVIFFTQLRDNVDELASRFQNLDETGLDYYSQRAMRISELTPPDRAARFLYLNRHSFNAVYRTNRQGQFNVPKGTRTGAAPTRDELISASRSLTNTVIRHCDYLQSTAQATVEDFVYLDPPYRNADRKTYGEYGYNAFGTDEDVSMLAVELDRLNEIGAKVLLSFNMDDHLMSALDGWTIVHVQRRRSVAANASSRTALQGEILAYNYEVSVNA